MKRALFLLALVATPALAQELDLSHGGPITVDARDGFEWRENERLVIATGDARATRGTSTVIADKLTAYYRKKTGAKPVAATDTEGGNEIYRLVAEGHVRIFTPTDEAKAARLTELSRLFPGEPILLTTSRAVGAIPARALFSARSKLARLGVASATAFQWVSKNERTVDWNRIRTAEDLHRIAAERFETEADERHYLLDPEAAGESARAHLAALRLVAATNSGVAGALVAYEADPAGHWAAVVRLLNHQRLENVREWKAYLTCGNEAYAEDPFWQSCAWGVVHAALTSDRNRGLGSIVPLHKGALAALRQSLEGEWQAVSLSRRYERLRAEYARQGTASVPAGGDREWVYIPSKAEAKRRFRENLNRLQALSCPMWCTKSYNAELYLERGGFWLLLEGGAAIVAVRLDGKTVAEIQGVRNDGRIPTEAADGRPGAHRSDAAPARFG